MDLQEERNILFISRVQGVVVKGLIRKLKDNGFTVNYAGKNADMAHEMCIDADIFVIYLDGDEDELEDSILLAGRCAAESEQKIVVIGEKHDLDTFRTSFPDIVPMRQMGRPVDPEEFLKVIGQYYYNLVMKTIKKNIMILDDDPLYAKMVREWLKEDYKVSVSTTPMEAINYLVSHPVDLILLDYEMPVFNGPQVLEMLRKEEETANIPVVFLTGVGDRESVKRVMSLQPQGYILKTTTAEDLMEWLKVFFEKQEGAGV